MVNVGVNKFSMKDPLPTWLLKSCIDLLAPYITSLFNSSLSFGAFTTCYKDAYVTPRLKKPTLPPCELSVDLELIVPAEASRARRQRPADWLPVVGGPSAGPSIGLPEISLARHRPAEGGDCH